MTTPDHDALNTDDLPETEPTDPNASEPGSMESPDPSAVSSLEVSDDDTFSGDLGRSENEELTTGDASSLEDLD